MLGSQDACVKPRDLKLLQRKIVYPQEGAQRASSSGGFCQQKWIDMV